MFLCDFNMRKIYKNIKIVLIFMLIGVFVISDIAYALRLPLGVEQGKTIKGTCQKGTHNFVECPKMTRPHIVLSPKGRGKARFFCAKFSCI